MTDLQIAITAGAAIALCWVLVVNFRERQKARKLLGAPLSAAVEPVFSGLPERMPESVLPNAISESVATLRWQTPCAVSRIQMELRGWRHVGSKPLAFGWVGAEGVEPVAMPDTDSVVALQIGVLLATRGGPLHAMEYAEWQEGLARLAGLLGAQLEMPSMGDVLARAKRLDQQCADVDAQLSICVTTDEVLSNSAIASAAGAAGLEPRGESRYAMGPLHGQRFSVFPGDKGGSLMLLLDVPRVADPLAAFDEMRTAAHVLAQALSGRVTDDNGRELTEQDFEQMSLLIAQRDQQLMDLGIAPGSLVAQRLFL